jgi:hypothetical protein
MMRPESRLGISFDNRSQCGVTSVKIARGQWLPLAAEGSLVGLTRVVGVSLPGDYRICTAASGSRIAPCPFLPTPLTPARSCLVLS